MWLFAFPGERERPCPVPVSTGGAQEGDEHEFWGLASFQSNGKALTGSSYTHSDDSEAKFLSDSSSDSCPLRLPDAGLLSNPSHD